MKFIFGQLNRQTLFEGYEVPVEEFSHLEMRTSCSRLEIKPAAAENFSVWKIQGEASSRTITIILRRSFCPEAFTDDVWRVEMPNIAGEIQKTGKIKASHGRDDAREIFSVDLLVSCKVAQEFLVHQWHEYGGRKGWNHPRFSFLPNRDSRLILPQKTKKKSFSDPMKSGSRKVISIHLKKEK